jgi:tetratricopeptide (TPR) repeat protein
VRWGYEEEGRELEKVAAAEEVVRLVRVSGDGHVVLDALHVLSGALMEIGQTERARDTFEQMAAEAEQLDDTRGLASSLLHLGWLAHGSRDHTAAVEMTGRGLAAARRSGSVADMAWATINLGEIAFDVGDWERAERHFAEAVPLGGRNISTSDPVANLLYVRLLRGDQAAIPDLTRLAGDPTSWAARYLAEWELLTGRPERARGMLEAALEAGIVRHFRRGWEVLLAESHLLMGDLDRADAVLGPIVEKPVGTGYPADPIQGRRVMGMLRARQGHWDEAHGYFERALAEAAGFPFVQGQVHHALGQALHGRGEHAAARAHLQAALTLFHRLGAHVYAAHTEAILGASELR